MNEADHNAVFQDGASIPFIVLSDVCLGANLELGDIAVLVKDVDKIVRSDPVDGLQALLATHGDGVVFSC